VEGEAHHHPAAEDARRRRRRAGRRALLGAGDRGEGSRPRPKAGGRGLREIGEEVEVDNAVVAVEDLLVELDRLDDAPLAVPQRDGVHLHRLAGQRRGA
jgi:hypothetical protein